MGSKFTNSISSGLYVFQVELYKARIISFMPQLRFRKPECLRCTEVFCFISSVFFFLFAFFTQVKAATYYAREAGPLLWSNTTSWSSDAVNGTLGVSCGCIPAAGDNVIIDFDAAPLTMTVDGNYSITNVTIGSGHANDNADATLVVSGANTLTITGNLVMNAGNNNWPYILDAAAGTISLAGTITWPTTRLASLQVSTGTLTFSMLVTLPNDVDMDITFTGAGTINFNAGLTDLGKVNLITFAGCTANFGGSYTNAVTAMVWNPTSTAVFTGNATITPTAAITFGNFQINTGIAVTQANNIAVAGNWTNNGGTIPQSGGPWTITFGDDVALRIGTIGGTSATAFPHIAINDRAQYTLSGAFTYTCVNLTFMVVGGGGATNNSLTHAGSTTVLTVSGNVTHNQPTTATRTSAWNINAGSATVNGTYTFAGASNTTDMIATIVVSSGALTITGAVTWMANGGAGTAMPVTTEVITVSTGTITFGSSLSMPDGSGTLSVTGAGIINFNGTVAPSFDFFSGAANATEINPAFTTTSGCTINFLTGFRNANAALTIADGSTSVFTGSVSGAITPSAAITFGNVKINAAPAVASLAGSISVTNNWTNLGGTFTPNLNTVTFSGVSATQIITDPETFYILTANQATSTMQLNAAVTITNTLNMSGHNFNLNGNILTLGNSAAATLTHAAAASVAYGGTFKRWFPTGVAAVISSTVAPLHGLFPIGISTDYRPVEINSTASPTTAGYVSASHTDALTLTTAPFTDNAGNNIERVSDMKSTIATFAPFAGGTYNLDVTHTGFSTVGFTDDLYLETIAGAPRGVGTNAVTAGTPSNPVVKRTALTAANLVNDFIVGTKDLTVSPTPIRVYYYSTGATSNWSLTSTWSTAGCGGIAAGTTPGANDYVYICAGHTVTVDVASAAEYIEIVNTGLLNGTANVTVGKDLTTAGAGTFAPTGGAWIVGRNLTTAGIGNSTFAGTSLTVTGALNVGAGTTLTMSNPLTVTGNFTVNGILALAANTATLNGVGATINGTGTISGSGSIAVPNAKTIAAAAVLTFPGTFDISGATTVTNNGTITCSGNLTGTVAGSTWINAAGSTLNMGGTTSALLATGTLTATASPNTVNYSGSGAQTIKDNAGTITYYNLSCSNASTKSMAGVVTVTNLVTVQDAAILSEVANANDLTGTAGLTMTGTSELIVMHTASATLPMLTGIYTLTAGTVTINQNAAGTATVRGVTYYNLNLNGDRNHTCSSVTSITNNLTVSNLVDITSNGILTVGGAITYSSTDADGWTLTNNVTAGSLTMSAGFTAISASTYTITITGSGGWTNNSTDATGFAAGTGAVKFTGTAAQTIGGATATSFYDLTINNTYGALPQIILAVNTTVQNTLTMTLGKVNLAGFTLTLGTAAATPGTLAYTAGFLYGGNFTRWMNVTQYAVANALGHFPMGSSSNYYRPLWMGITTADLTTGGTVTVNHTAVTPATYDVASHVDASWGAGTTLQGVSQSTWNVSTANGLAAAGTTRFNIRMGAAGIGTNNLADLNLTLAASVVGTFAAATNVVSPYEVNRTGLTQAQLGNAFRIGSRNIVTSPLPIDLLSFDAVLTDEKKVEIEWVTASEINNDYFTVEKSLDAVNWEIVDIVEGAGNSNNREEYSLTDENPFIGISYYRLKQTDYNGDFSYSDVVAVDNITSASFTVFPNPSNGEEINVIVNGIADNEILIVIYDITGNIAYSKTIENANSNGYFATVINAKNNLPSGVYNIMASGITEKFIKRLVIRK